MGIKVERGGNGIGLSGAVFIVFLVLKLTGTIDWSWWWITAPLWIGWAIFLVSLAVFGVIYGLLTIAIRIEKRQARKKARARLAARGLPRKPK